MRKALAAGWSVAVIALALVNIGARPSFAASTTYETPGEYYVTIPAGVTQITVDAWGGAGGAATGPYASTGGVGGKGGHTRGTIPVAEGDLIGIAVASQGGVSTGEGGAAGDGVGANGGEGGDSHCCTGSDDRDGGGGGGGSYVVRVVSGAVDLSTLVMAGGGGGGAPGRDGGAGGGGLNAAGPGVAPTGSSGGTAATGGTQSAAGAGGEAAFTDTPSENGESGDDNSGGGGGDGYYSGGGGGGGGFFGGGGGGTGWLGGSGAGGSGTYGSAVTSGSGTSGVRSGDGRVVVEMSGGATEQNIRVTSPNGGETWQPLQYNKIKWVYESDQPAFVRIVLTRKGKIVRTVVENTSIGEGGRGSFNWRLPDDLPAGRNYKIRVAINNAREPVFDSTNGTFTITD